MTAVLVIFLGIMLAAFVGGLVGTIASLFYTVPTAAKGKRGVETFKAIPPWNRKLLAYSCGTFLVGLVVMEVLSWLRPIIVD